MKQYDLEEIEKRLKKVAQGNMPLRKKSEVAENHLQRTLRIAPFMLFGGLFGFLLAYLGFYLWYHRLQKLQDILLQHQVIQVTKQVDLADMD
ncbi:hypothetical protein [uncultured Cocleimonas sp.]|uniref:hypothetical protein n=1 Tax=uncultured Cocleimonas sp. TaxID=1051587 RepID=UPI002612C019|nr:hypothetical protein [uncultured Cocleimonas sp.]